MSYSLTFKVSRTKSAHFFINQLSGIRVSDPTFCHGGLCQCTSAMKCSKNGTLAMA